MAAEQFLSSAPCREERGKKVKRRRRPVDVKGELFAQARLRRSLHLCRLEWYSAVAWKSISARCPTPMDSSRICTGYYIYIFFLFCSLLQNYSKCEENEIRSDAHLDASRARTSPYSCSPVGGSTFGIPSTSLDDLAQKTHLLC